MKFILSELLACFPVCVDAADIEAAAAHRPCVHDCLSYHIVGKIARGILAAAVFNRMTYKVKVLFQVDVERRNSPVALRLLRPLFDVKHLHLSIDDNYSGPAQFLYFRLFMAHYA